MAGAKAKHGLGKGTRPGPDPIRCAPTVTGRNGMGGRQGPGRRGGAGSGITRRRTTRPVAPASCGATFARRHDGASAVDRPRGPSGRLTPPAGPARRLDREAEIGLLETAGSHPQPPPLRNFKVGGSIAHAFRDCG